MSNEQRPAASDDLESIMRAARAECDRLIKPLDDEIDMHRREIDRLLKEARAIRDRVMGSVMGNSR